MTAESSGRSAKDTIEISDIRLVWDQARGTCCFQDLPVAMMWVDTTLAGLMSGVQTMVGTERFLLALQSEGRKSVEADWRVISAAANFREGFKAIANIAAVAGWGRWTLVSLDEKARECRFRAADSWEGRYQSALGVCWGSGMLAGKLAGYCSKLFGTNCWADQTAFLARGDACDEFLVRPSKRSIEREIEDLLRSDAATRADMAVALRKLEAEVSARTRTEEALRESEEKYRALVETTGTGFVVLDGDGRVLDANQEYVRLTGHERLEEILGRSVLEWTAAHHQGHNNQAVRDCFAAGLVRALEVDYVDGRGRITPVEINATAMIGGGETRILTLCRDISDRRRTEEVLRESESKYRTLFDTAGDAIFLMRGDRFVDCNARTLQMFGCRARDQILGHTPYDFSPPLQPDGRSSRELAIELISAAQTGRPQFFEWTHTRLDGTAFPVEVSLNAVKLGEQMMLQAIVRDISERKATEERIELLKHSIDVHSDGAYWMDNEDRIIYVNDAACRALGYERHEMLGMALSAINPRATPEAMKAVWAQLRSKGSYRSETVHRRKDGSEIPVEITATHVRFGGKEYNCGFAHDITERKAADASLKRSLAEKETLLRELYHRTKNNMQVIRAMLTLRAARAADPTVDAILRETDRRIQAMSMVHQMLYRSRDLSEIDLRQYVGDLATLLLRSYRLSPERIALEVDAGAVRASIDLAIPCGLILNELMSNALQHAFPEDRPGKVRIRLARIDSETVAMTFSDDGVGAPPGFDPRAQDSLGFRTIFALAEGQLRGSASFSSSGGVTWDLRLREAAEPAGEQP